MARDCPTSGSVVDRLSKVADRLRQTLATDVFGVRTYRVFLRRHSWSGQEVGQGTVTVTETELLPPPQVQFPTTQKSFVIRAAGREEDADCLLSRISLSYTESQLMPPGAPRGSDDFMYRLSDLSNEGVDDRYYVPVGTPRADRDRTIGWLVALKSRSTP